MTPLKIWLIPKSSALIIRYFIVDMECLDEFINVSGQPPSTGRIFENCT
jgi:hypothetical protein